MKTKIEFHQNDFESIRQLSFDNGDLHFYLHKAHEKKEIEDALGFITVDKKIKLLIIADGMGGHSGGAKASALVFEKMGEQIKDISFSDDLSGIIINVIEEINQAIKDLKVGAGTTLNIIELNKDYARSYHAGDSESYILGSRGAEKYITQGHSPYAYALTTEVVPESHMEKIEKNIILNGLGFSPYWVNVSGKIGLADNDIIFISSDNVPDAIDRNELTSMLTTENFEGRAEKLLQKVKHAQPELHDDTSFILFKYKNL